MVLQPNCFLLLSRMELRQSLKFSSRYARLPLRVFLLKLLDAFVLFDGQEFS